jgi:hypothetical protein
MASTDSHGKLISIAAKRELIPHGFLQIGRSRVYISDERVWSCVVEFQPGKWSKGSFLNVSAHWLWTKNDYLSFDYGGRIAPHIECSDLENFETEILAYAAIAVTEAKKLRDLFGSCADIAKVLRGKDSLEVALGRGGDWDAFNAAVAFGMAGDGAAARELFKSVIERPAPHDWTQKRQRDAIFLFDLVRESVEYRAEIASRIHVTRTRLKLPVRVDLDR